MSKAKTKPKSDFLGSKINSFPQLCLRVSGIYWYAGIEMQREVKQQEKHTLYIDEVAKAFAWRNSRKGHSFWQRLDRQLKHEGAYYHAQR
jgi:hypothetical protein